MKLTYANRVYALVQSSNDVTKLLQTIEPMLEKLEGLSDDYERAIHPDKSNITYLTLNAQNISDDFEELRYEVGELLERELEDILAQLWHVVTRPEEQRKFTLMKNKLEKITIPFLGDPEDYYESGVYPGTDPREYVEPTIKALKYLAKYWHRIERYQKIERNIKHGTFTLVNEYGYKPGEYGTALEYLDEASELMELRGFSELLYGKIVLTTSKQLSRDSGRSSLGVIGQYDSFSDTVALAVDVEDYEDDDDQVSTLCHEFGHRLWARFLTKEQKRAYVENYGWLSTGQLEETWKLFVEKDFKLAQVLKLIENEMLRGEVKKRWKRAWVKTQRDIGFNAAEMRENLYESIKDNRNYRGVLSELKGNFTSFGYQGKEYFKPSSKSFVPKAITQYGTTNPEEDFCETFMYYCMGWDILEELEIRFLETIK